MVAKDDRKAVDKTGGGIGIRRETALLMAVGIFLLGLVSGVALTLLRLEEPLGPSSVSTAPSTQSSRLTPEQKATLKGLRARVEKDPGDLAAWIQLGNFHFDMDRPLEAIEAYEKAIALDPRNPDVLTDLGTMYRRTGKPEKAVELYRKAQKVAPGHINSLYNLGVVLLHDLQDTRGAIEAWEKFLRVAPQGPQADHIRQILQRLTEGSRS